MASSVGGPIVNHGNIIGPIGQQYKYSILWEKTNLINLHIYGVKAIFLLFVITKTLSLSHLKQE